jgi:hypothetical protein
MPQGPGTYGHKVGRPPAKKARGGSAKNLTVPQMKANAAGMKPLIATKPKGDPTGQGLRGQALTGATIKRAKGGKAVPSSAETSVIKGASVAGSREGSTIKGPKAKGSREGSVLSALLRGGGESRPDASSAGRFAEERGASLGR